MSLYFDYNATTPVAASVIQKITECLEKQWGNPSSTYSVGRAAKKSIEEARANVASMIRAKAGDIIFTSGGTEANNIVIFSIVEYFKTWQSNSSNILTIDKKPHAITSNVEHDAVILPLRYLERKGEIELSVVPVSSDGCISVEEISMRINPQTCFVSIMHANNETGVIMPCAEIGSMLQKVNKERRRQGGIRILYHIDAAQTIGKIDVNVDELKVDYLTIVGHKFYGPRIGALYIHEPGERNPIQPIMFGGGQERGMRPGTENTPMIVGLGEAARLVSENLHTYHENMFTIRNYLEEKLIETFGEKGVIFNCSQTERLPNTCNVSFVGSLLNGYNVLSNCQMLMASIGAACHSQNEPSKILLASCVPSEIAANSIRLSVGRDTTKSDVNVVINDLKKAIKKVKSQIS